MDYKLFNNFWQIEIQIEYVMHGGDISPRAVEQAIQISETKYRSAMASLNADFESSYRIFKTA